MLVCRLLIFFCFQNQLTLFKTNLSGIQSECYVLPSQQTTLERKVSLRDYRALFYRSCSGLMSVLVN